MFGLHLSNSAAADFRGLARFPRDHVQEDVLIERDYLCIHRSDCWSNHVHYFSVSEV